MNDLRQYIEQYVQDLQSILEQTKEAKTDEELVSLAKGKWFDPQNPEETDPRYFVFLSAARRFPFQSGDASGTDEGDKVNEVPQPQPPK